MAADPAAVAALRQRLEASGQLAALKATLRAALAHAAATPGGDSAHAPTSASSLTLDERSRASAALVLDFLAACGLPATRAALLAEWRGLGASSLPSRGALTAALGLPPSPQAARPEGGGPSGPHTALLTQLVGERLLLPATPEVAAAGSTPKRVPAPAPPRAAPLQPPPPPLSPPASPPRQRPDAQAYPRSPVAVPSSGRMLLTQMSAPPVPVPAPLQPPPPPRRPAAAAAVATLPPVADDADGEADTAEEGRGVDDDAASAGEAPVRDEDMSPSTAMILTSYVATQQSVSGSSGSPAAPHVANSLSPETGSLRQLRAQKPAQDGASAFQPVAVSTAAATAAPLSQSISRTLGLGSELGRLAARYVEAGASPTGLGAGGEDSAAGGAARVRHGLRGVRDAPPPPAWQPPLQQQQQQMEQQQQQHDAAARATSTPTPVATGAPPSPSSTASPSSSRWDAHWQRAAPRGMSAADGSALNGSGAVDAGLANEEEGDTGTSAAAVAANVAAPAAAPNRGSALGSEPDAALAGVAGGPGRAATRPPPPRAAAHPMPAAGAAPNTGAVPTPPALSPTSTARVAAIRTHATELVASAARAVAASTAAGAAARLPLAGRALGGTRP
jgi:hypothetical protein